ncbi:MAG: XRE family transcriptional regulator [Desulfobacterales bacterium]|nr:XRE family transcriptional regulator [Pseudomonadota bacterium]MBU4354854.1 XRE family transcriptional regulator [Pseudomonadota bacterium]MCG2772464.1 XRE family transcriptional regulator [Desulfobacterales bacterium]
MKKGGVNRRFGEWLDGARRRAGISLSGLSELMKEGELSLRELGDVSEINYTMLHRVEQGERFLSDEKILRLARIFDEDPDRLIALQRADKEAISAKKLPRGPKFIPGFKPEVEVAVLRFLKIYRIRKNFKKITFPLDIIDFFQTVFGLETCRVSFFKKGWSKSANDQKLAALIAGENKIYINEDLDKNGIPFPEVNERFSLAHEGAHFIICKKNQNFSSQPIFFRSKDLHNPEERTVNYWAGAILMPKPALTSKIESMSRNRIKEVIVDLAEDAPGLCEEFGVSKLALEIRLRQIGIQFKKTL